MKCIKRSKAIVINLNESVKNSIQKELIKRKKKIYVVGAGITSSHLGDERNLREYLFASEVYNYLKLLGKDAEFYLADDSYDPLDFRQLRVAVKKDPILIAEYKKYCGMPLKLIPDPYKCHSSYAHHFQEEILKRYSAFDITPKLIDIYDAYESHQYDFAKKIIFDNYKTLNTFLKKKFPSYTMKKIFWILCENCLRIDMTDIKSVVNNVVNYICTNCGKVATEDYQKLRGKFCWKIDCAIKWNLLRTDFEAFNVAYLDPDLGSYFIAKEISKQFLGENFPAILEYRQVLLPKEFSYKLLEILPKDLLKYLFLKNIKQDLLISSAKIIQFANYYRINSKQSYYDYIKRNLATEILTNYYTTNMEIVDKSIKFSEFILNKSPYPKLPTKQKLNSICDAILRTVKKLLDFVILERKSTKQTYDEFNKNLEDLLAESSFTRKDIFPVLRFLFEVPSGVPMTKNLYLLNIDFIKNALLLIKNYELQ